MQLRRLNRFMYLASKICDDAPCFRRHNVIVGMFRHPLSSRADYVL